MTTDDQDPAAALRDRPNARTVFVSGNFNIVHPGHVRLLRFAADCGNSLTVGVLPDGEQGVTIRADDRLEGVSAISVVDDAFILTESVAEYIARAQPAIVVKGKEHERVENVEQAAVEAYGGKLIFSSGEVQFSSLDLLRREFLESDFASITHQYEYRQRHAISEPGLHQRLEAFSSLRVGVVGDLILDEYITCEPVGLSQEDPTIVVTPIDTQRFVGGGWDRRRARQRTRCRSPVLWTRGRRRRCGLRRLDTRRLWRCIATRGGHEPPNDTQATLPRIGHNAATGQSPQAARARTQNCRRTRGARRRCPPQPRSIGVV